MFARVPDWHNLWQLLYVTGTALDLVPEGKAGVIDIIPVGPYGKLGITVIVWKNTDAPVSGLYVLGAVRTATGELRAAVEDPVFPNIVPSGEVGFAVVEFVKYLAAAPAPDDRVTFEAFVSEPAAELPSDVYAEVPLTVTNAVVQGTTISGMVPDVPASQLFVPQMISMIALCFEAAGQARELSLDFEVLFEPLGPDATYRFEMLHKAPCDRFLITAQTSVYYDPRDSG